MARSVSVATMKILFGQASTCAFPGCDAPLVFVDTPRNVRSVSAEIAHIRSGSERGPRHVEGFVDVYEANNLILLCPLHHKPVDEKASVYTVQELERWKADQIATGEPIELHGEELISMAEKLDDLVELLTAATTLSLSCCLVCGFDPGTGGVLMVPLTSAGAIRIDDQRLILTLLGVEVSNGGSLSCQIVQAGIEFDVGEEAYPSWLLILNPVTVTPLPHTIGSHAAAQWLGSLDELAGSLRALLDRRQVVERFRGFISTADGHREVTEWRHVIELPGVFNGLYAMNAGAVE